LESLGTTQIVVVDDTDGVAPRHDQANILYVDDAFQADYLPGYERIIPRRNPSCKDFGLYYAYKEGFDVVILLDDDCDTRITPDFLDRVPVNRIISAHQFDSRSGWFNPMSLMNRQAVPLYSRGYPYEHRGEEMVISEPQFQLVPSFNEGLWAGTPDINGIDKISLDDEGITDDKRRVVRGPVALREGQHLPLSIMNVQLSARLIPAFYQPPDYGVAPGWRIRRHDDVWSMYFLKTLMDKRRDWATVGEPVILHTKHGDMLREAVSENCTNLLQWHLTTAINRAAEHVKEDDYAAMARRLAFSVNEHARHAPGVFRTIIQSYAESAYDWATLFF
jgi:hypothetical protein